ncbi:hypothetical protein K474DRAFT_1604610 [Panus rudis PR-1116 ss-1]|nr:hypothetical protein K474DRAFT_1604610 [Panus rudis PR-1116 ss-1]
MSASAERPCTTKPRGVCKYYSTPRGCFAGSSCKFLHGENERLTPYDKSKTCKFYAAGYCKRGANCWFIHSEPSKSPTKDTQSIPNAFGEDDQLCSICLEKPVTYGLLAGCSHIFCIQCIREWRDPNGKSVEVVDSGVNKKCPLCRAPSQFVTPSSLFYPDTHPGKSAIIAQYKSSMARVPCRHFQASPKHNRFCPFGKDCFYQHLNEDGTEYLFDEGVDHNMRVCLRYYGFSSSMSIYPATYARVDRFTDDVELHGRPHLPPPSLNSTTRSSIRMMTTIRSIMSKTNSVQPWILYVLTFHSWRVSRMRMVTATNPTQAPVMKSVYSETSNKRRVPNPRYKHQ